MLALELLLVAAQSPLIIVRHSILEFKVVVIIQFSISTTVYIALQLPSSIHSVNTHSPSSFYVLTTVHYIHFNSLEPSTGGIDCLML